MENNNILTFEYSLNFESTKSNYKIDINKDTLNVIINPDTPRPEWSELDFHKCSICPLDKKDHPHCPLALATMKPVMDFEYHSSTEIGEVIVKSPQRTCSNNCDLQNAMSSLLGLLMASSECPFFIRLKPMARFHLPFSSLEETMFRVVSTHFLGKYFMDKEDRSFEVTEILEMYRKLQIVNHDFLERLKKAVHMDSSLNAIIKLDTFARMLPISIEEGLEKLKYVFKPVIDSPHSD